MLNYQRVNIQRWKETKHMQLRVSSEKLEATEGPGISEKHAFLSSGFCMGPCPVASCDLCWSSIQWQ